MPYTPNRPLQYRPQRRAERTLVDKVFGFFNWRERSLLRGTMLVLLSTWAAFRLSHFPQNNGTLWLLAPLVFAFIGTFDTLRCMQPRWNWYHGGVLLCVYMDLMAVCMILFFLLYPIWL